VKFPAIACLILLHLTACGGKKKSDVFGSTSPSPVVPGSPASLYDGTYLPAYSDCATSAGVSQTCVVSLVITGSNYLVTMKSHDVNGVFIYTLTSTGTVELTTSSIKYTQSSVFITPKTGKASAIYCPSIALTDNVASDITGFNCDYISFLASGATHLSSATPQSTAILLCPNENIAVGNGGYTCSVKTQFTKQ
jgi:hypothetical protein